MTSPEFNRQWTRLKSAFRMASDLNPNDVQKEWFRALEHYHVDAVDIGITTVIRDAKETFWPALGVLIAAIRARIAGMDKVKRDCQTCHGSTWIEAAPWKSNGHIYEGVQRCPDCGVPAPNVKLDHQEPLTITEYAEWKSGVYRDTMPDWAKAKKPKVSA